MKVIPYGRQHITEEDIAAVTSALKSDFLTQGPLVAEFEREFATYVGAKYAVAFTNGTAALHVGALALGVNSSSKVLTTPITFVASSNCVLYCGGQVDFVDINPMTFNLDLDLLEKKLEAAPRGTYSGVVPVAFAGYPVDLERLSGIAKKHGLWIMEDACHAPGGSFKVTTGEYEMCGGGRFSDLSVFSFHPVKHIACGEGGMITTNDERLYRKALKLRTHGITRDTAEFKENHGGWHYEMQGLGFNYRIPDMNCALGLSQLRRADKGLRRRQQIAEIYRQELKGVDAIKVPEVSSKFEHAYHLFVIRTPARKLVYDQMKERGVYCQVHYRPVYAQPFYQTLMPGFSLPNAEAYYRECLSIPMFPSMTDEEVMYVCNSLKEICLKL